MPSLPRTLECVAFYGNTIPCMIENNLCVYKLGSLLVSNVSMKKGYRASRVGGRGSRGGNHPPSISRILLIFPDIYGSGYLVQKT